MKTKLLKKYLEHKNLLSTLNQIVLKNENLTPYSLDIGCATCRYPIIFYEKDFLAHGYDIDKEAIEICKLRIKNKNILEEPPEYDKYNVITCMMGTFNHIVKNEHMKFISWIHKSLKKNGIFIISCWNPKCSYTSYLNFYTIEECKTIKDNSISKNELSILLENCGFAVIKKIPFCYLPDDCYNNWLGEISKDSVTNIDKFLSKKLSENHSQMFLICGEKI